jgi:hypothetical protein
MLPGSGHAACRDGELLPMAVEIAPIQRSGCAVRFQRDRLLTLNAVDLGDMGMVQRNDHLGLALEPGQA